MEDSSLKGFSSRLMMWRSSQLWYMWTQTKNIGLNPDRNLSVDYDVCSEVPKITLNGHRASLKRRTFSLEELMVKGRACWLWDYLSRSNAVGYVVPLSGGIKSGCTATIVFSMCRIVMRAIQDGKMQVESDLQRVVGLKG